MPFAPGADVGPYRILQQIGQGGMATVFRAYHAALDRYVAIKVLHPALTQDRHFTARFEREAHIVAKLNHPNIIPIYDFSQHEGTPYLVMQYVEGKTLKTVLQESKLAPERVLAIIRPVAEGLAYAHGQGVLHRDIKPSNIMLADDGHVYIADFGLARLVQARDSTLSRETVIGTPQYLSPEQAKSEAVDPRSDLYSLGVVLFEMLTGRVPFDGDTPYAVIHDHIFTPLPLPTRINPGLSPEIERVLVRSLAKDRKSRYGSANELLEALSIAVADSAATTTVRLPRTTPTVGLTPPSLASRQEIEWTASKESLASSPTQPAPSKQGSTPWWTAPAKKASSKIGWPTRASQPRETSWWPVLIAVLALDVLLGCSVVVWSKWDVIQYTVKTFLPSDPAAEARERIAANPKDPLAHIDLAQVLANRKNYDAAYEEMERAIAIDIKSPGPYLYAGALAESLDDQDRALKYYQRGWQMANDNTELLLAQGHILGKMGRWDAARIAYEKVLRIDPNSALAMAGLGDYYRSQNKPVDALREYTRALAVNPNLPEAHMGLGLLALERGANEEAKRQFQMVVNNQKTSPELKEQANKQLRALSK